MRLLAVADLHGKTGRLAAVARAVAEFGPGAVVVAGDVAPRRDLSATLVKLNKLGPPVYLINGNCEGGGFPAQVARFTNLTRLNAAPTRCGNVHLFGLGGTLPLPFASRICCREAALLDTLSSAPAPSVLVVHPPPYGVLDQVLGGLHTGSRGLARWITSHQPSLVLCGHIHERAGMATMGTTTVINCAMGHHGGGGLIDFDGTEHRVAMLSPMALSPMV
jgi:uncharacterized protein